MKFNPSKCCVIRVAPTRRKIIFHSSYSLHGHNLEVVASEKYLGVHVDENLSWSKHISYAAAKGNKTLGFLRRNFRDCTPKVKAATYTMMVRPTLEYASSVWDPQTAKDINALEQVQRRAARYVNNDYRDRTPGCVTRMLNDLQWESLATRRLHNRLLMLFRIQNGLVDIDSSQYLTPSSRSRGLHFYQERATHASLRNSFFLRTISDWNRMPNIYTTAESPDALKAYLSTSDKVPAGRRQ